MVSSCNLFYCFTAKRRGEVGDMREGEGEGGEEEEMMGRDGRERGGVRGEEREGEDHS